MCRGLGTFAWITKGVEAESNILIGSGLAIYLNGTAGSAKYADLGLWLDSAPCDTETIGVNYHDDHWAVGLFTKRVGRMFNDNGGTHEAVRIDPFTMANLFDSHNIVAVRQPRQRPPSPRRGIP